MMEASYCRTSVVKPESFAIAMAACHCTVMSRTNTSTSLRTGFSAEGAVVWVQALAIQRPSIKNCTTHGKARTRTKDLLRTRTRTV